MAFANWKIGQRLALGFGLVLLMLVAMVVIAESRLNTIDDLSDQVIEKDWVKMVAISDIDTFTRSNARYTMELFIADDKAHVERIRAAMASNKAIISAALQKLEQMLYTEQGKQAAGQLKQARAAYVASFDDVASLLAQDRREQARRQMLDQTLPALERLQTSIKQMKQLQQALVNQSSDAVNEQIAGAHTLLLWLGLCAVVFGAGFAWWITRSITVPINRAVQVARTVATGDLTSTIKVDSHDEMGLLLQALDEMNHSLRNVVGQVRNGTDVIAAASGQIASGNLDLSSRTEQQASSLEETASSMEELTATVKQNGAHTRHAHQLAISASSVADRSGSFVSQVVETMDGISAAASRIVDIIAVIDGIAFQTNILALNAAVEAARAGEQGRGFAVVASEVRNLAQRSAAAAKEIKTLIGDAVDKVGVGSNLVAMAGSTMQEVVVSVKRVSDIMDEIASANREQEAGIEQINQAVVEMDTVTQQNAALVEESAAAAASMQQQAANLASLVSIFQLQAAPANARHAARPKQPAMALLTHI